MEISSYSREGFTVVSLSGRLDAGSAPDLEEKLLQLVSVKEARTVLDAGKLEYISSAGLRVLLVAGKNAGEMNGILALVAVQPGVSRIISAAGLDSVIVSYPTIEDALKATG